MPLLREITSKSVKLGHYRLNLFLFVVILSALAILNVVVHPKSSDMNLVKGRYESACCGAITLNNGYLSYAGKRVDFELRLMKFGLTGYPSAPFGDFYGKPVDRNQPDGPSVMIFNNDTHPTGFDIADRHGRDVFFKRQ
jgi:hypothetical protein